MSVTFKQNTIYSFVFFRYCHVRSFTKVTEILLLYLFYFTFSEYLAVFKKTVQVHEVFLQRLSSHPTLSKDRNFQIFLEYDQDVSSTLC